MKDLNKTELTHAVTEAACQWLLKIGAKPVHKEVPVARRWIADIAGLWVPTRTEAQAQKLIPRSPPWAPPVCDIRRAQYKAELRERERRYHEVETPISILHEVKTSVSDFRGDSKWRRLPPSDVAIVSLTQAMLPKVELPERWWVILHDSSTGAVKKVLKRVPLRVSDVSDKLSFVLALSERGWNIHHYAEAKQEERRWKDEERQRHSLLRISRILYMFLDIIQGAHGNVEDCIRHHIGVHTQRQISRDALEKLAGIYGMGEKQEGTP